jgi:hypothetical protein
MVPVWPLYVTFLCVVGLLYYKTVQYRRSDANGCERWMYGGLFYLALVTVLVSDHPPVSQLVPEWVVSLVAGGALLGGFYTASQYWRREM